MTWAWSSARRGTRRRAPRKRDLRHAHHGGGPGEDDHRDEALDGMNVTLAWTMSCNHDEDQHVLLDAKKVMAERSRPVKTLSLDDGPNRIFPNDPRYPTPGRLRASWGVRFGKDVPQALRIGGRRDRTHQDHPG